MMIGAIEIGNELRADTYGMVSSFVEFAGGMIASKDRMSKTRRVKVSSMSS